jgi:diguanylate cyclase (GGDEF)-like protein/PAS domain S-box-containing protein
VTNERNSVIIFSASDHRCIAVNDAAVRSYGYARDEFVGLDADALCASGRTSAVMQRAPGEERGTSTTAHRRKDGSEFDADETVFDFVWAGVPASILLTTDVTERVRAENALRADADAASRVHRLIAFGHWSTELDTGVTTWSDEMWVNARLPKPPNSSSPGKGYEVVKRHMHPDDRQRVIRDFNDTASSGRVNRIEYRSFRGDGTMHWEEVLVAREVGADGKPVRLVGTCIDISARKEASELLALSARTDMLTGLANRTMLNERLAAGCSAAKRRHSQMAVLFLDLNGFKRINDTLGHAGGDLLLQSVSTRLRSLTRAEDLVARAGGDEFVIVLEDPTAVRAAATARRILDAFRAPLSIGEHKARMSFSIGIACFPADGGDGDMLMRNADTAMYRAKLIEGGAYRIFDASMNDTGARYFDLPPTADRPEPRPSGSDALPVAAMLDR